ncbi:MAG: proline--tRNA ligase [Anaerolineae bacterium]
MRLSQLFGRTLREVPADAELTSHQLLLRANCIRAMGAGIYTYMHLGWRVALKIQDIFRQEMDGIGCQEMSMPVLNPSALWQNTGRWDSVGPALIKLKDRRGQDYALAMTHEEVVAELTRREIDSYRQLPRLIYHIQTKLRDEIRARGGLIRVREFIMKDAYSLDVDAEGLDKSYDAVYGAYERIFERCAVQTTAVEADTGMMGGSASHEFVLPHPQGEDRLIGCAQCDYAANVERAELVKDRREGALAQRVKVATPDCPTIADVAAYLNVPVDETFKAVLYMHDRYTAKGTQSQFLFVLIRGDLEVNEIKLLNVLGEGDLRAAQDEDILATGCVPGYASPIGLKVRETLEGEGLLVVADDSIQTRNAVVSGANDAGYHFTGVNYPRDFQVTCIADIAQADSGHTCPRCGGTLQVQSGIELGHTFKLGTWYSEAVGATYLDAQGESHPVVLGSYGIGVGRLMAAIVEVHHDEHGIMWPRSVAPYQIHLVALGPNESVMSEAEALYQRLLAAGYEVLYDDRDERAGVKFADADLIGAPLRLTLSKRSLKVGGVEAKARHEDARTVVSMEELMDWLAAWWAA